MLFRATTFSAICQKSHRTLTHVRSESRTPEGGGGGSSENKQVMVLVAVPELELHTVC